jgi:hypothetical protein
MFVFFFSSLPRWFKRELTDRLTHHFAKVAASEPLLTQVSDRSRFPKKKVSRAAFAFSTKGSKSLKSCLVSWRG